MSIHDSIQSVNKLARKVHGADISILVARAVTFGHTDNLILVMGANHEAAARDLVRLIGGAQSKVVQSVSFMDEPVRFHTEVSF